MTPEEFQRIVEKAGNKRSSSVRLDFGGQKSLT